MLQNKDNCLNWLIYISLKEKGIYNDRSNICGHTATAIIGIEVESSNCAILEAVKIIDLIKFSVLNSRYFVAVYEEIRGHAKNFWFASLVCNILNWFFNDSSITN